MSAHERQAIVSLLTTLLLAVFFVGYLLPRYPAGNPYAPEVFHFWGVAFVILVPVSIVANITVSDRLQHGLCHGNTRKGLVLRR